MLRLVFYPALDGQLTENNDLYPGVRLQLRPDYRLFDQVPDLPDSVASQERWTGDKIPTQPLPAGARLAKLTTEGHQYWTTNKVGGQPLHYALAADLAKLVVPEDSANANHIAVDYVRGLPANTKVVLVWE